LRVLNVIPRLAVHCGGPVTAVLGLTNALSDVGVDVKLITTGHFAEETSQDVTCETRVFPARIGRWQWSRHLGRALREEVSRSDVVTLHTLWNYPVASAAWACRSAGVPYILRTCGMLDSWSLARKPLKKRIYNTLIQRRIIDNASALWFTSEKERDGTRPFGYGCGEIVLPLGVQRASYEVIPDGSVFRSRHPDLKGRRIILYLGRINPEKQPGLLIEAFAEVGEQFPDTTVVIAGPDECSHSIELKRLAQTAGISHRVYFAGIMRGDEVKEALAASVIFVLASKYENFGLTVIEAMACGIPVIVSDMVSVADVVAEYDVGRVISPNRGILAESLRELLLNPGLAERMGAQGRRLAMERFTWDKIVPSLISVYEQAIDGKAYQPSSKRVVVQAG
jgi:glycosyltransferase involved in cell wall biosynthesis